MVFSLFLCCTSQIVLFFYKSSLQSVIKTEQLLKRQFEFIVNHHVVAAVYRLLHALQECMLTTLAIHLDLILELQFHLFAAAVTINISLKLQQWCAREVAIIRGEMNTCNQRE